MRLPKVLPLVGVLHRRLQARPDDADRAGGDREPALVERVHRDLEALALCADQVLGRHLHVREEELAGRARPDAQLVLDLAGLDALPRALDDERRDAAVGGVGVGLGEDELVVGLGGVRDPVLLAVQQIGAVGLADRGGQHRRHVGSGGRLGQAEAAELLALRHRLEVLALLLLAAVAQQRQRVQADVHRDQRPEGRLAPLDLLADQRLAHVVEAGAAVLDRDRRAQEPELGHPLDDPHVEVVVDVVLLRDRQHPPVDELAHRLLDRALLVSQL